MRLHTGGIIGNNTECKIVRTETLPISARIPNAKAGIADR